MCSVLWIYVGCYEGDLRCSESVLRVLCKYREGERMMIESNKFTFANAFFMKPPGSLFTFDSLHALQEGTCAVGGEDGPHYSLLC